MDASQSESLPVVDPPPILLDRMYPRYAELAGRAASIRTRITDLYEELSAVLAEQNSLLPINRAPDDILASIFAQVVASTDPLGKDWAPEALRVSYVCRRWRTLALALPTLWASVYIENMEQAKVFLIRSRASPLSVVASPIRGKTLDSLGELLAPHMHRIRRLHIQNYYEPSSLDEYVKWAEALALPASALEDLRLTMYMPGSPLIQDGPLSRMLGNSTPALRLLTMIGFSYPSTSPLFTNLVRLDIERVYGLPFRGLLEILQRNPDLEYITLTRMCVRDEESASPAPHVPLPCLSKLYGEHDVLQRLLPHLIVPRNVSVRVDNPIVPGNLGLLRALLPRLSDVRHIRHTFAPGMSSVPPYAVSLYAHDDAPEPVLRLVFDNPGMRIVQRLLPDLAALYNVHDVTTFTLEGSEDYYDTAEWIRELTRMKGLKTFRLVSVANLGPRQPPEVGTGRHALLHALAREAKMCPALRRLEFDWLWDSDDSLVSVMKRLAVRRPALEVVRRPAPPQICRPDEEL